MQHPETPTPEGEAYIEHALEVLGSRDPRKTLEGLLPSVEQLISGMSERQSDTPEAPGKWSVSDVLHHLAGTELVYGYRVRIALTVARPLFEDFDQEGWARSLGSTCHSLESSLGSLRVLRRWNLEVIRGLDAEHIVRGGVHSKRGFESVEQMIGLWAAHDLIHLSQIRRILERIHS